MRLATYNTTYYKLFLVTGLSFSIFQSTAQVAEYSKSYINITKGSGGGTIETGDVLEIRATFAVRSGSFDSCAYYDVVPAGTSYVSNSLRILTNEGKIYKLFTDGITDDAGWRSGSTIRMNLGYNPSTPFATAYQRGTVSYSDRPSNFNTACIMVAAFRVTVTASAGTNISIGGGSITTKNGLNSLQTYTFQPNTLKVYSNYGLGTGITGFNLFTDESNGTFGTGKPRNRAASSNVPTSYGYQIFNAVTPNDNSYGISNNTSTRLNYTTLNTWPNPDITSPSHRVFSVWDIIGDHTGAVSAVLGNPAADTVANPNAGYMLVVNSAYKTDSAFQATVTGLCPNTLYEITGWFRNICPKCGCDSNGTAATDAPGIPAYIPTAPGDSSGVSPNLIFEIDGVDHYTTGNIPYNGQWTRKGFSLVTGSSQTSFILRIFNNAPAGSGNDWALDDITVVSVSPTMKYAPSTNTFVCKDNAFTIYDTIRSAAGNYFYYKWQRSTNNGASWTDVTTAQGPASTTLNGSLWQYVASYTISPANTTLSDSGDIYRAIVSGTATNLSSSSCRYTEVANYITLNISDCGVPLEVDLTSFTGLLKSSLVTLNWTVTGEKESLKFDIEKSINKSSFTPVYSTTSLSESADLINNYSWTDPDLLRGKVYYRLKIYNKEGRIKYSQILVFSNSNESLELVSINNPFNTALSFTVYSPGNKIINTKLIDASGKIVKNISFRLVKGTNYLQIDNTSVLEPGLYILWMESNEEMVQRKLIKQ
jgi:hypothetical protein